MEEYSNVDEHLLRQHNRGGLEAHRHVIQAAVGTRRIVAVCQLRARQDTHV